MSNKKDIEGIAAGMVNLFNDDKPVYSLFTNHQQCLFPFFNNKGKG